MNNTVKKILLFLLAVAVSAGVFSLGYKVLDMKAFDASIAPTCILVFSICLLYLPTDEE